MTSIPNTIRKSSNADGGVVLDLRRGTIYRMNPIGARILDLLEQGSTPAQVAAKLSAEFAVPFSQVEADVMEFVQSLTARGVIDLR